VLEEAFVRSFVGRWVDAWNAHDADALLELCAADVVWDDPAANGVVHGREGARRYLHDTWTTFPDLSFELLDAPLIATDGGRAAQVWRLRGTMLGPDPAGFAPTGKRVEQVGIDLYEFRDGLLARYRALYDLLESGRQMGLVPAAGSRPARIGAFMQRTSMRLKRRQAVTASTKQTNAST
jgi:steroid delta-isomerase-like uncharacterized protein